MDIKLIAVILIMVVVTFVGTQYFKQRIFKKLVTNLQKRDFDAYFKVLDSLSCKYFYPPFNREYMRLNAYMMIPDQKKIGEQFDLMLGMRMAKKQDLDVSIKAFYYYLDEENKKKCRELLERLKKLDQEGMAHECEVIYDIFLCKETKYIETMEEQLKDPECKGLNRGMFQYMLGLQYGYKKDHKKEMEYLQLAKEELKETPYAMKIDELLK